jgi:energy-coupling factor transporter ATP-binding protein EcfA2
MVDLVFKEVALRNVNRINIVLGRNGAGKSRLLRSLDKWMAKDGQYRVRYVSPERAGIFNRDANVETNMVGNPDWAINVRRANQSPQFKAMSHVYLRNAESAYLRQLQNIDARGRSFQLECLDPISRLLANVSVEQGDPDFMFRSSSGALVKPDDLSSGESETIALASEILHFFSTIDMEKQNILLLDEPDVHQHPDLQSRFGRYLLSQLDSLSSEAQSHVMVILATHSTSLVCSLVSDSRTSFGTKEFDSNEVFFQSSPEQFAKVAAFFGHPLSLTLSNDPILIMEGEDDERVWQQVARSSCGRVRFFPVVADSVDHQSALEAFSGQLLESIFDEPVAYSIRDGDGICGPLPDIAPVKRFRLECYSIENVILTTECLQHMNASWNSFRNSADQWVNENPEHKDASLIGKLIASPDRMRFQKIKAVRQLIASICSSRKPWEVVVGQSLASVISTSSKPPDPYGILRFIGEGASKSLLKAT